jgi:hypothetical protein
MKLSRNTQFWSIEWLAAARCCAVDTDELAHEASLVATGGLTQSNRQNGDKIGVHCMSANVGVLRCLANTYAMPLCLPTLRHRHTVRVGISAD